MPSSRPHAIPTVIGLMQQLAPRSILDIGIGFGKWGHLFREYAEIVAAEHDPARYQKANWQVRIDGVEAHAAYLTDMHRYLYDCIHVGDACDLVPALDPYDVIFLGDVIEHFTREDGERLLDACIAKANKAVIVLTPSVEVHQGAVCDNEYERHRSAWDAAAFARQPHAQTAVLDGQILLAVMSKEAAAAPLSLRPPRAPSWLASKVRNLMIDVLGETTFERLRGRRVAAAQ